MNKSKMVVVWRKDLKVRKGKIFAQLLHAAFGSFLKDKFKNVVNGQECLCIPLDSWTRDWIFGEFTKICVYVDNEEELLSLYNNLVDNNIKCCLITDAGHTEFHNVPTNTCVGIGPINSEVIDKFTRHLPLL